MEPVVNVRDKWKGWKCQMAVYCISLLFLALLAREDIREKRVSAYKILGFAGAAVLYLMAAGQFDWGEIMGSLLPGGLLLLLAFFTRESIGYGDGAAVAALGLWTGGCFAMMTAAAGIMLAGAYGIVCLFMKKKELIPFLPFLLLGMEVVLFYA